MKNIVFIVGSIRKGSFNAGLAEIAGKALEGKAEITYLRPDCVPAMNQDREVPVPEEVAAVRKIVKDADGIWIFTPEYNRNMPGLLKNLLDWLSRPVDFNSVPRVSAASGKIVTISGVGGKGMTAGARTALDALLKYMGMTVVGDAGNGFALPPEAFSTGVWTPSEEVRKAIAAQAEVLLNNI